VAVGIGLAVHMPVGVPDPWVDVGQEIRLVHLLCEDGDVIVTVSTPGALAAKHATSTIPIVFSPIGDPIGAGLITDWRAALIGASVARLGVNAARYLATVRGLPGKSMRNA
jgi:hypothetical protein